MSTQSETLAAHRAVASVARPQRGLSRPVLLAGFAALAWLGSAALTQWWLSLDDWPYSSELIVLELTFAAIAALSGIAGWRAAPRSLERPRRLDAWLGAMPWLLALALGISAWEALTAKLEWLPRPFFAPPQALLGVYVDDFPRLASSVVHSFGLLAYGYVLGAVTGFAVGVSIGWSRAVSYWLHPVLRLIGPLPATAWLPLPFLA